MSKKENELIIKLAKQVDLHTKQINEILESSEVEKRKVDTTIHNFSINASFLHPVTITDKEFLTKLGQNISKVLGGKDVQSFDMKFKK